MKAVPTIEVLREARTLISDKSNWGVDLFDANDRGGHSVALAILDDAIAELESKP